MDPLPCLNSSVNSCNKFCKVENYYCNYVGNIFTCDSLFCEYY